MCSFMINNEEPQGCHPPGDQRWSRNLASLLYLPVFSLLSSLVITSIMSKKIDFSPDSLPNISCFDLFVRDPKGCKPEMIQGAHSYLSDVMKGRENGPKNSVFIGLFNRFTKTPVKDYVFRRMTKSILQELALCILQELISGGPERAANLNLVVEETKTGGKTVVVEKPQDEFPVDHDFVRDIDEAFFRLTDLSGSSPDKKVVSGQGHHPPYSPPDERGFFTPIKATPKSLGGSFEVNTSREA